MTPEHARINRRNFLMAGAAGIAGLSMPAFPQLHAAEPSYPASSLSEAFDLAGFNPASPGYETFVVAADCHYGMNTGEGLLPVIREVNAMRPRPAFFLVNGDFVVTVSTHFGHRPNSKQREIAREELQAFKQHVDRLEVPLKLTLGNHDTHPGETEPELVWSVLPDVVPYSFERLAGVNLYFLNGHSDGNLDDPQRKWLAEQLPEQSQSSETMIFVHQPALGSIALERGIPITIHETFATSQAPLWLVGGHHHTNLQQLFRLPRTSIVQQTIVCSAAGIWGGPERPGYWIYGISDGRVQARIFRRLGHGYRVEPTPDRRGGIDLPLPYANQEGLIWKIFVGEGDAEYRVQAEAGDVGSWLSYVKQVTYRLPLKGHPDRPREVGVLGRLARKTGEPLLAEVFLSSTGASAWEPAILSGQSHSLCRFEIPAGLQSAPELFIKCVASKEVHLAGYSLWS